jgi:hypothetical protein
MLPNSVGITPINLLSPMRKVLKDVNVPIVVGMEPVCSLKVISMNSSPDNPEILDGNMPPTKLLE